MPVLPTDLMRQQPIVRLPDVAALADIAEELLAYHAAFASLYRRREQRRWGEVYLRGLLLAEVPRKHSEALALRLLGAGDDADGTVRALQDFIGVGGWDDAALLAVHRRLVDETLGAPDGVRIIDGSDVPKQGTHAVGVAWHRPGGTRRAHGQERQLPGGGLPGLRQRQGRHPAGPAAVSARVLVHRRVRRPLASGRHPPWHAVPDQARLGGHPGGGRDAGRDAARALGGLR